MLYEIILSLMGTQCYHKNIENRSDKEHAFLSHKYNHLNESKYTARTTTFILTIIYEFSIKDII